MIKNKRKRKLIFFSSIVFGTASVVSSFVLSQQRSVKTSSIKTQQFITNDPKDYYDDDDFWPDLDNTLTLPHGSDYLFKDSHNERFIHNLSTEVDNSFKTENIFASIVGRKLQNISLHTINGRWTSEKHSNVQSSENYNDGVRLTKIPKAMSDIMPLWKDATFPKNRYVVVASKGMKIINNWHSVSVFPGFSMSPTSKATEMPYFETGLNGESFQMVGLGDNLYIGMKKVSDFLNGDDMSATAITPNNYPPSPFADGLIRHVENNSPLFNIVGSKVDHQLIKTSNNTYKLFDYGNFHNFISTGGLTKITINEAQIKKQGESTYHDITSSLQPKFLTINNKTFFLDDTGIYLTNFINKTNIELTPIFQGVVNPQAGIVKIKNHYLTQKIDGTNVILDDKFQDVTATKVTDRFVYGLSLLPKISYGTHGWYNTTQLLDFTICDDKLLKWGNTLIPLHKLKPMKYKDILHDTMWSSYFEETFEELDKVPHPVDPNQKLNATLEYSEDDGATWKSLNAKSNITLNKKYLSRLNVDNVDKKSYLFRKSLVQDFHIPFEVADYSNLEIKSKFIQYKPGGDSIIKITPPIIKAKQNTHYEYALYDKKSKTKKTEWTRSNFISIKTSDISKTNFIRIRESYNDLRYPILESRKHPFAHHLMIPINVDASKFIPTFDSKSHNMTGHNLTSYNNVGLQFKLTSAMDSKDTTWDLEMPKHLKTGDIIQVRYINLDETKVQIFGEKKGMFYVTDSTIFGDILAQIQVDASKFTPTFDKPNKVMKTSNLTSVNGVDIFYSVLPLGGSETTPTKTIPTDKLHKGDLILARYVAKDPTTHTVTGDSFAKFVVPDLKKHITVDASKHNPKIDVSNNMTDSGITIPSEAKIEYALQKKSQTKGSYSETLPTALHIGDIIFFKLSAKKPDDVQLDGKLESHWTMKETINVDASTFAPTIDDLQRKMTDTNIKEVKGTKIQYRVLDTNAQPLTKFSEDFPKDLFNKYIIEMKFIPIDIANTILIGTQTAQFTITSIKVIPIFVDLSSPNLVFMSNGDLKLGDNIKNVENLKLLYQVYDEKGVLIQKYSSKIPNNLKFGFSVQVKYESAKKDYRPIGIIESSKMKIEKFNSQDSNGNIILYGSLAGGVVFIGLSTFIILTKLLKGKKIDRKMFW